MKPKSSSSPFIRTVTKTFSSGIFATFLFGAVALSAPQAWALGAGDLMFTALNVDEDGFAMVALVDIPENSTVYFTDNEWDGSAFNTGESYSQWVSGSSIIPAGTVIRFIAVDKTTPSASVGTFTRATVTGSANWGLSGTEDSVYAYQAESVTGTPTFLSAICNTSFGTASAGMLTNTGLSVGNGALQTGFSGGSDFAEYNGDRSGKVNFAAYLPLVSNVANWTVDTANGDFAATVPNTNAFTVIPTPTVDLSKYVRVGRFDLPSPAPATPPEYNLLAQEASGVAYNWDTDTLFIVGDGGTSVTEVKKNGEYLGSMTLAKGSDGLPQFLDTEGITYIGGGQFVMTEERVRQAVKFTYVNGGTLERSATQTVKLGTTIGNVGLEGVTYDPLTNGFFFAKELDPQGLFQTGIDFTAGTATNGSPATVNSTNLFETTLADVEDMSDVFAFSNLPALTGQPLASHLLVISQESGMIRHIDRAGNILSSMALANDAGSTVSIQDQTHEGITMDRDGNIYIVSENGGGDINHPQLWVYAPSSATNQAPSAVAMSIASSSIPEDSSTAAPIKLANILVTDAEGVGVNGLTVSGPDASSFQIIGTGLYLKAGTTLNFQAKPTYNVTVNVDDATVGTTPDASTNFTLNVTKAVTGPGEIRITEITPWGSSYASVAARADWFELTNVGASAVDISGWKMFDSGPAGFGSSRPLNGVTSIAPGESVIFLEDASKIDVFRTNWFGANPPAGLQIGSYDGAGAGLSTGGDAVNIYDPTGVVKASVSFGGSTILAPYRTFDNTQGQNGVAITQLSTLGVNGAFAAAASADEIGSPGSAVVSSTSFVSITATDADAAEAGNDPGTFRISRTGSTLSPMTVLFSTSTGAGQATSDDYNPILTSPATIPAGASFVDITITPVDDAIVESAETVTLTLGDTGSYDVGSPASATITIVDNDIANLPPTAVVLNNKVTTITENTPTTAAIKVADIAVNDDGQGINNLTVTGADAALFEITGTALYLKAGTSLNHTTQSTYDVTVEVDDATVGTTPDSSVSHSIAVLKSVAPGSIIISEISPWSSTPANSRIGVDWFEVTNVGTTTVDITGWKWNDSSDKEFSTAKALNGITSIAPGESVIFLDTTELETKKAEFLSLWFGANPPAGLRFGNYNGPGMGSGGDAANLFDTSGNRITGVSFGASPSSPFATFDNKAGLGSTGLPVPVVSTLSVVGVNGAFTAADDANETGSPGRIMNPSAFSSWLAAKGYTSGGFNADSDNDGVSDGVEFFFNQNPNSGSGFANLPQLVSAGGALSLGFTHLTNTGETTGELMVSGNLNSWTSALLGVDYTVASSVVTGEETAVTYALPGTGPSAPGVAATHLAPNTASDPIGASLGGVRIVNEGLVGVGRLTGNSLDKFGETQGASSGVVISDWAWNGSQFSGKLNVLPDRGYGDGTSNYAARLHEVGFTFTPYYGAGPVPQNQVSMTYLDSTKFTYQDGAKVKFTTGLNPGGISTLFGGQTVGTVTAANGQGGAQESLLSFDAEAVYLFPDGSGFVSDEYGTYIARFNPAKKITGITQLPEAARPYRPGTTPNFDSITAPTTGRRNNQGLEGMSVTPDGTRLFALLQSATVQDTDGSKQQTRNNARLFVYDIAGGNLEAPVLIGEYVVKLPRIDLNADGSGADGTAAQSEIVALGASSFLMLPRDGNGLGKLNSTPITFKSVQLVDFASASNILGQYDGRTDQISPAGVLRPEIKAAATSEIINMLQQGDLTKFGLNTTIPANANTLNEKIEGMALVPDLSTPATNDFFLFVGNDNDFQSSDVKMLNAAGVVESRGDGRLTPGVTNDAMFYVWRLTIDADGKKFFRFEVK